jgi:hypothetical protein
MIGPNEKNPLRENTQRRIAELALMFAVPVITNAVGNTRLDNLQRQLQQCAMQHLSQARSMTQDTIMGAIDKLREWGDKSGWTGNPSEHTALICFCLVVIEDSPVKYPHKIYKLLNLISEHLEKGGKLMTREMLGGQEAADTWAETYEVWSFTHCSI